MMNGGIIDTCIDMEHPVLSVANDVYFVLGKPDDNDNNVHDILLAGTIVAEDDNQEVMGLDPKTKFWI